MVSLFLFRQKQKKNAFQWNSVHRFVADKYLPVRNRLLTAVPQPVVITGGAFLTLDTLGASTKGAKEKDKETSSPILTGEGDTQSSAESAESTPSKRTAKRAAEPVDRSGLIHVASVAPKVAIPGELQRLPYAAVVLELHGGEFSEGGNNMLQRLAIAGVPMLVVGRWMEVEDFLKFLQTAEEGGLMVLQKVHVDLCVPARNAPVPYRFTSHRIVLITKTAIPFKV